MSNSFFRFKQFTIHQQHAAMKVTTDACLFGAYVDIVGNHSILDIGTGTGLLSLMLAQRSTALIEAIEIDEPAYKEATDNIKQSPWNSRISVHHGDFLEWLKKEERKFDLIISNPPFFTGHLKSEKQQKNVAKHADTLPLEQLPEAIANLLSKEGVFHLMLPPAEMERFISLSKDKLYLNKTLLVRNYPDSQPFRNIASFSFSPGSPGIDEIIIYEKEGKYTARFMELLSPYYLYL